MKFEWESISCINIENVYFECARTKVFGGWLIRDVCLLEHEDDIHKWKSPSSSTTFIPDPNHEWVIDE